MLNKKAVSPVVGFVLVLAVISLSMALLQAQFLPAWEKRSEAKSSSRLLSEVSKIPEVLTQSSSTILKLDLGVRYTKYPLLVSPPSTAGYVRFIPENVTINATIAGTTTPYNRSYKTDAILVHPFYVYLSDRMYLYEYGAVFENGSNYYRPAPVVNQISFYKNTICIPILNSTEREVAGTNIPLNFFLVSKSTGIPLENVNITVETKNVNYWNHTLRAIYGASNVSVRGNDVTVHVRSITLYTPSWVVSSQKVSSNMTRAVSKIVPLSGVVYVSDNSVTPVSVVVVDQFGNPYPGVMVNATVKYGATNASISPARLETNIQGEVTFYVYGLNAGNATLNFTAGSANASVEVRVLATPVPTPVPTVSSIDLKGNLTLWNYSSTTSSYTGSLNATAKVLDVNGNPVSGVPVTITLSVLYYKGGGGGTTWLVSTTTVYTNTSTTDSSGVVKLSDVSVNVSLSATISYKYAYTELSASCYGVTTSYTNYSSIASATGGGVSSAILTYPYTICYP